MENAGRLLSCLALAGSCALSPARSTQDPQAGAGNAVGAGHLQVVSVPYRQVKHQALVEVQIKGQGPFTFLIDTGVAGAAIDSGLAARLGIELDETKAQELHGGPDKGTLIYQTFITDLSVGDLAIESLQAAALELGTLGRKLGEPLHGILGDGFLKTRATRFDHVHHTISFAGSIDAFEADVAGASYTAPLTLSPESGMPMVEVFLDGRSFHATIDTGSSLGLEIFTPHAEELGLGEALRTWKQSKVTGGSIGEAIAYDGSLPKVEIGPLRFEDLPASLTPPRLDEDRKGNIGNQVWEGYVLILDYPAEKLLLRKSS